MNEKLSKFPKDVSEKLSHYVYRLIDPRNGETFYIGKGIGNRVFEHLETSLKYDDNDDESSLKIKRIRDIHNTGLKPLNIIHRHGMTKEEALLVEASLIDAYPGLTNEMGGQYSSQFGPASTSQILQNYLSEEMKILNDHKIIAISINDTVGIKSNYDAVRHAWRISVKRAEQADFVFATSQGVCKDVFVVEKWLPSNEHNFPGFPVVEGRYGFVGKQANKEILDLYLNKRLPSNMQRVRGMASPILYNYEK